VRATIVARLRRHPKSFAAMLCAVAMTMWLRVAPLPAGSSAAFRATPVSFQMSFSFVFVPDLSPRETNVARPAATAAAIASNAEAASWGAAAATPAGSPGGPTITKSFHMIVRPKGSSENPSATNRASKAGAWVISTSPCPARALVIA
jgi:hypothetical protein